MNNLKFTEKDQMNSITFVLSLEEETMLNNCLILNRRFYKGFSKPSSTQPMT